MATWYSSFSADGQHHQILDGDCFKTFGSPEEVKKALDRWAYKFQRFGETFAICKETYKTQYDDSGRIARIESITEAVEFYTVEKGA